MPSYNYPSLESSLSARGHSSISTHDRPSYHLSTESEKHLRSHSPAKWQGKSRSLGSRIHAIRHNILLTLLLIICVIVWFAPAPSAWGRERIPLYISTSPLRSYSAAAIAAVNEHPDPLRWLADNTGERNMAQNGAHHKSLSSKPRAALITLVRNQELDGMLQSMQQLEFRWNSKYHYPWVFFNEQPFTEEFKAATRNMTSSDCYYEQIPVEHWSMPDWIDQGRFWNSLEYLGTIGVGKGWMESYRHMCRWNSGFFYRHPRLEQFDFYWRVEPDVHFYCDINYDVFQFMQDNKMKYGFTMNILDDARSFPSLWSRTRSFINAHPELLHAEADLDWLLDPFNGGDYNNCQFFSNFEVGDLRFFRGEANEKYFRWLDRGGGFYYERFGDAPIHTLSVAMFVPKREIWYFRDIGYQHDINRHCPPHSSDRCDCDPTAFDENFYKLVPLESAQKKPADTCIRQFLGGDWLKKREGWDPETERAWGGDGYHGYVYNGFEEPTEGLPPGHGLSGASGSQNYVTSPKWD